MCIFWEYYLYAQEFYSRAHTYIAHMQPTYLVLNSFLTLQYTFDCDHNKMYVQVTSDFPVVEFYMADGKHALACHVNVWVCIIDTLETRNGLLGGQSKDHRHYCVRYRFVFIAAFSFSRIFRSKKI